MDSCSQSTLLWNKITVFRAPPHKHTIMATTARKEQTISAGVRMLQLHVHDVTGDVERKKERKTPETVEK